MIDYKTTLLLEIKDKPLEEQVKFLAEKYNEAMNLMWQLLEGWTGQKIELEQKLTNATHIQISD